VVVTITCGGYAKRTKVDLYRSQKRGGKGVRGAALKQDDIVEHFFTTTTHHWLLFFTNRGRVYRAKSYELPEAGRDARGQHVANLLEFQPDESIAQVLTLRDYGQAPYLVLATKNGKVKKTKLEEYDSNRSRGLIAINLQEDDEVIGAELVSPTDDLLLVSRKGMSVRFTADDAQLRPMGRATAGVTGMKFRAGDALLSMSVVTEGAFVFTVTDGGFAKRTPVEQYRVQNRSGLGIKAMKLVDARGALAGALVVDATDEVLAVTSNGGVIRSRVDEVNPTSRDTMGVRYMNLVEGDVVLGIARNAESDDVDDDLEGEEAVASGDETTETSDAGTTS
jgi:DNA gyrase subunit A